MKNKQTKKNPHCYTDKIHFRFDFFPPQPDIFSNISVWLPLLEREALFSFLSRHFSLFDVENEIEVLLQGNTFMELFFLIPCLISIPTTTAFLKNLYIWSKEWDWAYILKSTISTCSINRTATLWYTYKAHLQTLFSLLKCSASVYVIKKTFSSLEKDISVRSVSLILGMLPFLSKCKQLKGV